MDIETPSTSKSSYSDIDDCFELDIGEWIAKSSSMTRSQKINVLRKCWTPSESYDFRKDVGNSERQFIHKWLDIYEPWLCYSRKMKGPLCLYCVLFPPTLVQGVVGAFIAMPFTRYKHMHENCRNHAKSQWHQQSIKSAKHFMDDVPVDVQTISGHRSLIEENRKIIYSIISTIIFCGTHDLALRGKQLQTGDIFFSFYFLKMI